MHDPDGARTDRDRPRADRRRTARETESESERCPECRGALVTDAEHGETVCENCGLVVEEDGIDHGPEWRAFDAAEKDRSPAS
ncbi:transcription initiation factor IIB 2, partial [Halapricum sp. CBA1109]|uniref:TFIIB-type zinc ribbon-containing protein n=1 Tax=Halapricum sp. CBA1109 TaxID=2668068 RepID=UPI0013BE40B0|nr:transcription initiation factor IIB 2 [Halapricum sp. CBA1109]